MSASSFPVFLQLLSQNTKSQGPPGSCVGSITISRFFSRRVKTLPLGSGHPWGKAIPSDLPRLSLALGMGVKRSSVESVCAAIKKIL